eukprot:scaffold112_cov282-Prasinococcus_capsulatus_cf.AAC.5
MPFYFFTALSLCDTLGGHRCRLPGQAKMVSMRSENPYDVYICTYGHAQGYPNDIAATVLVRRAGS